MEMKFDDFNAVIKEIVVAHKFKYDKGAAYGYPNGRKTYGLIYILSGDLEYAFSDGRHLLVKPEDMFLLKPTDSYKIICRDECLHYTVNFMLSASSIKGDIAKNVLFSESVPIIGHTFSNNFQTDTLDKLCNVWTLKSAGYRMNALSLVYKLLFYFLSSQTSLYKTDKLTKLTPAKEYIEAHWNEQITLATLASVCNISVTHLRHLFSEVFSTTPMEYRDSIRLLYAKDYLLQENYTISEVAYKCGFDDVNYFSRFFKKHIGTSPSKYRSV